MLFPGGLFYTARKLIYRHRAGEYISKPSLGGGSTPTGTTGIGVSVSTVCSSCTTETRMDNVVLLPCQKN